MTTKILYCSLLIIFMMAGCKDEGGSSGEERQEKKNAANTVTGVGTIVFFGNSLTAGYGLDPSESFPSLLQQKIDSLKLPYKVVNAGVSGETTAGGAARIDWVLKQPMDVFVLELGANDGLRGLPVAETKKNLQIIIDKVKQKRPQAKVVIAGMQVPPNMGVDYAKAFNSIFHDLATSNKIALIPFLLEGVGGVRELNLPDGIHPTAQGQKIVAANVWRVLEPQLQQ
jgi:acyl-CoA thioesterase I